MSDQFGNWGEDDARFDARIKREQEDSQRRYEREFKIWDRWHKHVQKFTVLREQRPSIAIIVNTKTGVAFAREMEPYKEFDERTWVYSHWEDGWSRVRAEVATRWIRSYTVHTEAEPSSTELADMPAFLFRPSDERASDIRQFKPAFKQAVRQGKAYNRGLSTQPSLFSATLSGCGSVIIRLFIIGGLLGLLLFGWRQLF